MSILKTALTVAFAVASTSSMASVVEKQATSAAPQVSTCYYQYSILAPDGVYDVYTCYNNFDGTY